MLLPTANNAVNEIIFSRSEALPAPRSVTACWGAALLPFQWIALLEENTEKRSL